MKSIWVGNHFSLNYCVSILINSCKESFAGRLALIDWDSLRDKNTTKQS